VANKPSISTVNMPREDWLKHRMVGIGGSDVGAILGLSKWKTPLQVWEEKKGIAPPQEETPAMKRGILLEPSVIKDWEIETKRVAKEEKAIHFHPEHDILLANTDSLILDNGDGMGTGILEAKTVAEIAYSAWDGNIPIYYYVQLQHYLNVMGLKWGEFSIWILGWGIDSDRFPVVRDETLIDNMTNELMEWWMNHIVKDIPPPMKEADTALAKALTGSRVEATDKMLSICNDLNAARAEHKRAEERKDVLAATVKEYMQDSESLYHGDMLLVTYKNQNEFQEDEFTTNHSELAKRYQKISIDKAELKKGEKGLYKQYSEPIGTRKFLLKLK